MLGFLLFGREKNPPIAMHNSESLLEATKANGGSIALDTLPSADYENALELVRQQKARITGGTCGDSEYLVLI